MNKQEKKLFIEKYSDFHKHLKKGIYLCDDEKDLLAYACILLQHSCHMLEDLLGPTGKNIMLENAKASSKEDRRE